MVGLAENKANSAPIELALELELSLAITKYLFLGIVQNNHPCYDAIIARLK